MKKTKKIISIVLFALAAILLIGSVAGYILRATPDTAATLDELRTSAVLHCASDGLIENIAGTASAAKLKELRARDDFRQLGTATVTAECENAANEAREEAKALYGNTDNFDSAALETHMLELENALLAESEQEDAEKAVYADYYNTLMDGVTSWVEFVGDKDDETLKAALIEQCPELAQEAYADAFVQFARDNAEDEQAELDAAAAEAEAETDETAEVTETTEEETVEETETVDYKYFTPSETLNALTAVSDEVYEGLWAELVNVIPDLATLKADIRETIQEDINEVIASKSLSFSERYAIYDEKNATDILEGSGKVFTMWLAVNAEILLIAALAVALLASVYAFWRPLTTRMGVPRTIIIMFFIYLCFAARLYSMNLSLLIANVLERVGMYGILVLAMLPGIQCGIGLNMGMTIGCISGLLGTIIALQYNLTGLTALIVSCILGALIGVVLGGAYSILLNRMKGSEMTISTYVGYSFVSLMCIGWMVLPFTNPKIVFPLRGSGLRVTHGLLGNFAHILDNFLSFRILGAKVPTGLLLVFLIFCLIVWLFTRTKTGIAMKAAGSNPRFAEASGINVDHMRSLGTILSTVLAAIGIVIYSSAFGYAQLYNAPKQLGFIAASAILIGGASTTKAKVSHVIIGVFLFEGVLSLGQQVANAAVAGGGLSEVMRIMISNGIILYALTQSGGATRD